MASAMSDLCKTAELAENTLAVFLKTQNPELQGRGAVGLATRIRGALWNDGRGKKLWMGVVDCLSLLHY